MGKSPLPFMTMTDLQGQSLQTPMTVLALNGSLRAGPEYNFSISGVLKNTIDWLSRLPSRPLKGKPVAILSATAGAYGGARHQYELRKVLLGLDALVLQRPEVLIGN